MEKTKNILAIETSCDETAAAVLSVDCSLTPTLSPKGRGGKTGWPKVQTLSSIVKSQIKLHSKMGGVVPETAARAHVKYIRPVVKLTINNSRLTINDIDYIAVTAGPGLLPSLMVGVEFAKALSFATGIPMIPVNHMMGHLYSPFHPLLISPIKGEKRQKIPSPSRERGRGEGVFPMVSLIVSGGHTMLVLMPARGGSAFGGKDTKNYKVLGQTIDDAAGEAFDKVAKMLELPYPGGPEVSRLAMKGNPNAINFPRPMLNHKNYNFSFSGLKTAVLYYLRDHSKQATPTPPSPASGGGTKGGGLNANRYTLYANICASFQQAVVDVLVAKTLRAAQEFKARSISLSGGVAANLVLREQLKAISFKLKAAFFVPPKNLCTDNAEMISLAASFMLANGFKPVNYQKIKADSNLSL